VAGMPNSWSGDPAPFRVVPARLRVFVETWRRRLDPARETARSWIWIRKTTKGAQSAVVTTHFGRADGRTRECHRRGLGLTETSAASRTVPSKPLP